MAFLIAAAFQPNFVVIGMGAQSCGQWIEAHKEGDVRREAMRGWLGGYLTGANAVGAGDIMRGGRVQDAFMWMDGYCRNNPTVTIQRAADALIATLLKN